MNRNYKYKQVLVFGDSVVWGAWDKEGGSVCRKEGADFIEIFEDWTKIDYKKLLEDGLHPNSEGHQKIFEKVKGFLEEKNWV